MSSMQTVGLAWHAPLPPFSLWVAGLPAEDLLTLRVCPWNLRRLFIGKAGQRHTIEFILQSQKNPLPAIRGRIRTCLKPSCIPADFRKRILI